MNFKDVRKAIIYEYITDTWNLPNGTIDDLIDILKPLNPEMILRAFFRWTPKTSAQYDNLKNIITRTRSEIPNVIITGGIPAHRINYNPLDVNDVTGEVITAAEAWNMALDPAKWGFTSPKKQELQDNRSKYLGSISSANAWFPDITNARFREFALSWAEKQIDAGVDSIWIDILWAQARFFWNLSNKKKDPCHQSVIDSVNGTYTLMKCIKDIGKRKGKTIYVGSWFPVGDLPLTKNAFSAGYQDYATETPSSPEILCNTFDTQKWIARKSSIINKWGDVPTFAFIDWGGKLSPMQVFSQWKEGTVFQEKVLTTFSQEFLNAGFKFVYPVHGADTQESAKVQAYGKYDRYDAKAPEFNTYNKIKELINNPLKKR